MQEGISNCRIERFNNAGHFIMLDEPQVFMETLRDFLDSPTPSPETRIQETTAEEVEEVYDPARTSLATDV